MILDLLIWVKRRRRTLVQASECASLDSDKKYEMTCHMKSMLEKLKKVLISVREG
jgi:hypothetical protein